MAYSTSALRLGVLAWGLTPANALAGPPEVLREVVVHPTDPSVMILRYENVLGGVFYSADGGRTFRIRPSTTFTPSGLREDTTVAFAGDALLLGSSDGLFKTDTRGCATSNPVTRVFVDAVATDPTDPSVAYYATSHSDSNARTGLWRRDAKGAIMPVGDAETALTVTGMQIVGARMVQTAMRDARDAGVASSVLRTSEDRGQTWREQTISGAGTPRLLAVDPRDPQRIVIALRNEKAADPILVTLDGGASWQSYLGEVLQAGQAAVAPDGRLWISDIGDDTMTVKTGGLWAAPRIGEPLTRQLAEVGVTCLAHDRTTDQLWLCQDYELDRFDPSTRGLCRVFTMTDLAEFVQCGDVDLATNLEAQLQLCGGYCGALHFAEAKLCEVYDDPYGLCGPPARYYDEKAQWLDPAGARDRCTLPALVMDAGVVAPLEDAGLPPTNAIDAGSARKSEDGCALASRGGFGALALAMLLALRRRRRS